MSHPWVDRLQELIPPPSMPLMNAGDWEAASRYVGWDLPLDFRAITGLYGRGGFGEVSLVNPFVTSNKRDQYMSQSFKLLDYLTDEKAKGLQIPFPLYPSNEGLLPCGVGPNGGLILWQVRFGYAPEESPIIYYEFPEDFTVMPEPGIAHFLCFLFGQGTEENRAKYPNLPWGWQAKFRPVDPKEHLDKTGRRNYLNNVAELYFNEAEKCGFDANEAVKILQQQAKKRKR